MSKICNKCGNQSSDNAKFCNRCGSKLEEIVQEDSKKEKCRKCGFELKMGMKFCPKCGTSISDLEKTGQDVKSNIEKATGMLSEGISQAGTVIADGLEKGKERFGEFQNMSTEEKKEKAGQYANVAKEKSKEFVGDVTNFKHLSKRKKKKVIISAVIMICVCLMGISLFGEIGNNGISSEEKIEIAKSTFTEYGVPVGELLSSGGKATVLWSVEGDTVKAVRDGISFEFVVNSDGSGGFQSAKKDGDELSDLALEAVFEQYYEIGSLSGTLP